MRAEVAKICRAGHRTTHHVTKPGKVQCRTCGVPVWVSAADLTTARAAAVAPPAPSAGALDGGPEWASETPFGGRPARLSAPERGHDMCGPCGAAVTAATPRGTAIVCQCGTARIKVDAGTAAVIATAQARKDAADRRVRDRAAAERAAAEAQRPRPLAERLDIAETVGTVLAAIDGSMARLDPARAPEGWRAGAERQRQRLRILRAEVTACEHEPDPIAALDGLRPDLEREGHAATDLAERIEAARDSLARALAQERAELAEQRRAAMQAPAPRALPAGTETARRAEALALMMRQAQERIARQEWCAMPHRFRRAATHAVLLSRWVNTAPSRRVPICGKHDGATVAASLGMPYYRVEALS